MNEETLQELLVAIQQARASGLSDREISSELRRNRNIPVNSTNVALQLGQAAGFVSPQGQIMVGEQGRSTGEDLIRLAGEGLTLGLGDELAGVVAGTGAFIAPGGRSGPEAFRDAQRHAEDEVRAARENTGLLGTAADIGGSLLPLVGTVPGLFRAIGKAPGAIRAGARALRSRGAREMAKEVGRRVPSVTAQSAKGAVKGSALGGGLLGLEGAARSTGDLRERLEAGLEMVPVGVAGGGLLGMAADAVPAVRSRLRAPRESGEVLAGAARETSGLSGRASRTAEKVKAGQQAARKTHIRPLEARGRDLPIEATETVLRNPVLREHTEAIAPHVVKTARASGASTPISAEELLAVRRSISDQASAFRQAAGRDIGANVNPINVAEAERALGELDEVMENLDGFPQFQQAWARQKRIDAALLTGRRLAGRTSSDDLLALMEGKRPADMALRKEFPNGLPDDPEVVRALREGLATEEFAKLESGSSGVRTFIDNLQTGSQVQDKWRVILGGEENLQRFLRAVETERGVLSKADLIEEMVKAAGFLTAGTSLFGGGLLDIIG